jgi:hypothetical protein
MMAPKRNVIEQLRQAIKDSSESEYAIGKGAGVHQSVVYRFMHEERDISLATAAKLCAYLKLDLRQR